MRRFFNIGMVRLSFLSVAFAAFFIAPPFAYGAVSISEIAWMGSVEDANHEWIELYNNGSSAVSFEGWHLSSADGTPNVTLHGTIAAGEYWLLERTSDATVPSVVAGQMYTGALGNSGEILSLTDASGALIDRVDGSHDWAIGGDNLTKDTLQRTGSGGWITAVPTPGRINATVASAPVHEGDNNPQTLANTSQEDDDTERAKPVRVRAISATPVHHPLIVLEVPEDITLPVGSNHTFAAQLFDKEGKETLSGITRFNWGDGTTSEGRIVDHAWRYPGIYRVVVSAQLNLFRTPLLAEKRFTVSVKSARVSIIAATDAYIELRNDEEEDVDISGWQLSSGSIVFTFPKGTFLAPGSVRMTSAATGIGAFSPAMIGLSYASGARVISEPRAASAVAVQPALSAYTQTPQTRVLAEESVPARSYAQEAYSVSPAITDMTPASDMLTASLSDTETSRATGDRTLLMVLFLICIMSAGIAAAILVRRKERPLAALGFRIVDAGAGER